MLAFQPGNAGLSLQESFPQPSNAGTASSGASSNLAVEPCSPREEDCSVCLAPLSDSCVKTPCGHYFHAGCLDQYFMVARTPGARATCPLCRGSLRAPVPIDAIARSGRPVEVVSIPLPGALCHLDRNYSFRSLGDFARPRMLYLLTCNEDRKTPANQVDVQNLNPGCPPPSPRCSLSVSSQPQPEISIPKPPTPTPGDVEADGGNTGHNPP